MSLVMANHIVAAAVFGIGYIAGIAPLIRLTEGEQNVPTPIRAERLGLHLLYGVLTAIIADGSYKERLQGVIRRS
ncbi:MAG: hypothetical protein ACREU3_03895 [Steroidobacteraceae bacterium]